MLFKYANNKKKRFFVSTANEALVGTLMNIGDVNNIFPIGPAHQRGRLGGGGYTKEILSVSKLGRPELSSKENV